ncbi:unnamed protein product [Phyllotreta striolata]|uniref:Neutral ceramidase n=1 Tax=Phyllotreta striolata TaxID=444603 RepID=A0A9N9XMZ3_PHYSR|nr:unnamed protein product [Phyllotreta striolata]
MRSLSIFILLFCVFYKHGASVMAYKVGVGRADCTGPSAEITFMGYAKASQKGCGIHLRQFARAFIFDDGTKRVAFVSIDSCMMNNPLRQAVLKKLKSKYGNTYTADNLVLSGTHTHSSPGGFLMDVMLDIPNFGFVRETFDALVAGIVRAIGRAHDNIADSKVFVTSGELLNSNINRSPASYELNPADEIKQYKHNTDTEMVQLKIVRNSDNKVIGALNWFAVHPTSMNNTNCLLSSDNVGYASILLESSMNTNDLPGQGDFVGAFASTNLGDVSPNTKGPICVDTGEKCDYVHSTCHGENKYCIASGPGNDMFESTEIIATNIFNKAQELLAEKSATEVKGDVGFVHRYVDMPSQKATIEVNGTQQEVRGCLPAVGYGFAAGTTDGPGEFDFAQGKRNSSNIFWNFVRDFIFPPTPDDVACHAPKPILIMSGRIKLPYEWQPRVVVTQILKIGNVFLTAVPGEFTTMSGRRLRNSVKDTIMKNGGPTDTRVVITGLSNVYTNYIATPEEYQLQRYEGGSTIYGPHTLTIYLKLYQELAEALMKGQNINKTDDPTPFIFPSQMLSLVTPVYFDSTGSWMASFGDCIVQPSQTYKIGETASATFIAGHPRNNNLQEKTFLAIEMKDGSDWKTVATDANWETKFIWQRASTFKATSHATIKWEIRKGKFNSGTYRIRHYGNYKFILGGVFPYVGVSRPFTVTK